LVLTEEPEVIQATIDVECDDEVTGRVGGVELSGRMIAAGESSEKRARTLEVTLDHFGPSYR